ncbi:hypothetical protein IKQ19_14465 [Candidatus Saccharibacteria bacterium]|nr:hypothetical protein [Candidatus Saccharibacteria bacterium]
MEKIIGGVDYDAVTPMRISRKILWPCYEFIAYAEGLDGYGKNIIEDVILHLINIKITSEEELASCMGLEKDLVSFVLSRLEQQGYIDLNNRITEMGLQRLNESTEIQGSDIHVYVDAVSGRLLPYFNVIGSDRYFKYSYGKEIDHESGESFFEYKGFSTAGAEKDEKQEAYKLHFDESFNVVPNSDAVTAVLHRLHPGKDSVFAQVDPTQVSKRNRRWFLIDVMQPEGSSRDWVFSDGFGKISTFFTSSQIKNEIDNRYISSGLRSQLQVQTNAFDEDSLHDEGDYPKLKQKIDLVEKNMRELQMSVDSPDRAEMLFSAVADSVLYLTQLAEWVLYYALHKDDVATDALIFLDSMNGNKDALFCVGSLAFRCARSIGFDCIPKTKDALCQKPTKVKNAYHQPSLLPLLSLFLITFEKDPFYKDFAKRYPDFLQSLLSLNFKRGQSFHAGKLDDEIRKIRDNVDGVREQLYYLVNNALGVKIKEKNGLSFLEKINLQNERDEAIGRIEKNLGFALCHTLDPSLIRFVTDMERRGIDVSTLNNAIIIDQYKIMEFLFVSANKRLGNSLRNSDWMKKVVAAGFDFSENKKMYGGIMNTQGYRVQASLERKPSTMNAACIAFCILAEHSLLRKIANRWKSMIGDINYIVKKRGHGEIPAEIDPAYVLEIKRHIVDIIHFFAEEGYLV